MIGVRPRICYHYRMISYLSGRILKKGERSVILDVGGVGYKVNLSTKKMLVRSIDGGKETEFFCYTNTKKDPWEIYGFFSADELDLFEFLIKISGIGPKAALEASSLGSLDKIKKAIESNDQRVMEDLFALGRKKAQAIIFELSRKMKDRSKKLSKDDEEAVKALIKLGFGKMEAKDAILRIPRSSANLEEKIREVLKSIGKTSE